MEDSGIPGIPSRTVIEARDLCFWDFLVVEKSQNGLRIVSPNAISSFPVASTEATENQALFGNKHASPRFMSPPWSEIVGNH